MRLARVSYLQLLIILLFIQGYFQRTSCRFAKYSTSNLRCGHHRFSLTVRSHRHQSNEIQPPETRHNIKGVPDSERGMSFARKTSNIKTHSPLRTIIFRKMLQMESGAW